jgi:uncharacterized protein
MNVLDREIKSLMSKYKKYAVYGLSNNIEKASHYVPVYMRDQGWDIVGTYPKDHDVGQFKIFDLLSNVPSDYRKMVNVFRSSERIPEVIDEVLAIGGIELIWLQLGISHPQAEQRAEAAGIKVISNRCMIIEHKRWF